MSSPSGRRSPLWFCYECRAEMRPLMVPEPHCASCNGTFLEEIDGTGDEDPRQIAAENEQSEAILNILQSGLLSGRSQLGSTSPLSWGNLGGSSPRDYRSPGSTLPSSRMTGRSNDHASSPTFGGFGAGGGMPPFGPFGSSNTSSGSSVRFELRSGPNGRAWTFQRGNAPGGRGPAPPDDLPSFQDFVHQRMNSAPTSPVDDEIETPFGPRFRRPPGFAPATPLDDPRSMLIQYLMGMLSGNPALMFDDHGHGGPFQGSGAFGDYVFNQEGLDRIVTQLMEAAGQHKPNPAPEELIANLKRTDLTYDCDLVKSGQSCAICTEYFAPPDASSQSQSQPAPSETRDAPIPEENTGQSSYVAITLPCGHPFHDDCIITWLKSSGTCPVCRFALVEQPNATGPGGARQPTAPGAASSSTSVPQPSASTPAPAPATASTSTNTNTNTNTNTSTSANTTSTNTSAFSGMSPAEAASLSMRPQQDRSTSNASRSSDTPSSPQRQAEAFFNTMGGPVGVLESIFGFFGPNQAGRGQGGADPGAGGHIGREPAIPSTWPTSNSATGSHNLNAARSSSPALTTPRISTPIPHSSSPRTIRTPTPSGRNNRSPNRSPSPSPMPAPPIFFSERLSRPSGSGSGADSRSGSARPSLDNRGNKPGNSNTHHVPGGFDDVD